MTRYKTKVKVSHAGKLYPVGAVLPSSISKADIEFLKSKRFVEVYVPEDESDNYNDSGFDGMDDEEGFDEANPDGLKTPEEIVKIRSKKAIKEYADSIGYDLGEDFDEKPLKELQEEVILFQEENADAE